MEFSPKIYVVMYLVRVAELVHDLEAVLGHDLPASRAQPTGLNMGLKKGASIYLSLTKKIT